MADKPFLDASVFDTDWEHSSRKDDCLVNCPGLHKQCWGGKGELHPKEIFFGEIKVNSVTEGHTVTLTNTGQKDLVVNDILVVGDFTAALVELFPITIGPGGSIEVLVFFRARANGLRTGGIYFDTGDAAGMEFVELSGSGIGSDDGGGTDPDPDPEDKVVSMSPTSLSFGAMDVGSTTAAKNITLKNDTGKAVSIASIVASGDYTQTNNCGSSLSNGSSCVIAVRFKPTAMGARTGALKVSYDSTSKSAALTGQGTDPSSVLPTLSVSDGVIKSGESTVALRAYPDGATDLTSVTLDTIKQGESAFADIMIKAMGTAEAHLTNLPSSLNGLEFEYGKTHGDWSAMTEATLEVGETLYMRITVPESMPSGAFNIAVSFKANGLAKVFNATGEVQEAAGISRRIAILGNQFYRVEAGGASDALPAEGAFRLKSVNWFGNESPNYTFHGVWARRWTDILDQIKSFGFNCIRLPFCGEQVQNNTSPASLSFDADLNPEFVGKNSLQIIDMVVQYCQQIGLYIVLDHHRGKAGTGTIGNPVDGDYTLAKWLDTWSKLAQRYASYPNIVGADVHNEPHDLTWTTWANYVEQAGAAIHAVNPNWIIFCQGVAQYNDESYWWGGQLQGVKDRPVKLSLPNKVAYSPHEYGQSVGTQSWLAYDGQTPPANWPNNLASVWDTHWGFIYYEKIAPLWVGEFGGHFGIDGSGNLTKPHSTYERQWLAQLIKYMNFDKNLDNTVSGTERPNSNWQGISFAYWCYNPNSGDTGGLVQDDWTTPQTVKLNLLTNLIA